MTDHLGQIKGRVTVMNAAHQLGMEIRGNGRSLAPCPACGATRRGSADPRGPVGLRPDGNGWRCHRCDAAGSVVDLITWAKAGGGWGDLAPETRAEVIHWASACGWCDTPEGPAGRATLRDTVPAAQPAPKIRKEPEVSASVRRDWWHSCTPVVDDAEVSDYLRGRKIDPLKVTDMDLARVLPAGGGVLADRCRIRGWAFEDAGYRLVVPMFDAGGDLAVFQVGRVRELPEDLRTAKAASLRGFSYTGTVMASGLARVLLAEGLPIWWPSSVVPQVIICEGVPDYLTAATAYSEAADAAPAVLGVIAGSFSSGGQGIQLAARVPRSARVVIQTDHDAAGDQYASAIHAALVAVGHPRANIVRGS